MTLLDLEASMLAQQRQQQQQSDDASTAVGMSNDLPSSSDANVPVEQQQSDDDRIVPDSASFTATDPLQLQPVTPDNPLLAITPTTPIGNQ